MFTLQDADLLKMIGRKKEERRKKKENKRRLASDLLSRKYMNGTHMNLSVAKHLKIKKPLA
jgi:hypothetical protein